MLSNIVFYKKGLWQEHRTDLLIPRIKGQSSSNRSERTKKGRAQVYRHRSRRVRESSNNDRDDTHKSVQCHCGAIPGCSMSRRQYLWRVGVQSAIILRKTSATTLSSHWIVQFRLTRLIVTLVAQENPRFCESVLAEVYANKKATSKSIQHKIIDEGNVIRHMDLLATSPPMAIVYLRPRSLVLLNRPAMTGPGTAHAFVIA